MPDLSAEPGSQVERRECRAQSGAESVAAGEGPERAREKGRRFRVRLEDEAQPYYGAACAVSGCEHSKSVWHHILEDGAHHRRTLKAQGYGNGGSHQLLLWLRKHGWWEVIVEPMCREHHQAAHRAKSQAAGS